MAGSSPLAAAAAEAAAGFPRPDGEHRVNPRRAGARFPRQRRQFRRAGSYHRARAGERGGRGRGGAESSGSGPDAPGAAAARPGSAPRARSVPASAAPRADAGAESAPARGPPAGEAAPGGVIHHVHLVCVLLGLIFAVCISSISSLFLPETSTEMKEREVRPLAHVFSAASL